MSATSLFAAPAATPNRVAFLYVPNGIVHDAWKPVAAGRDYELPYSLEPLRPIKSDVSVLTGLSQIPYASKTGVGHARPTAALLTGTVVDKETIRAGQSLDQIIADRMASNTKLKSLELSINGTSLKGRCDSGFSCAYSSVLAYRNATSPLPTDNNPRSVFKRLFGEPGKGTSPIQRTKRQELRHSVLDSVLEDALRLHRSLGKSDQRKLDEYLYSVRELERRVQHDPSGAALTSDFSLPAQTPTDYAHHVRLLGDLMVLAFRTDATRICTFMFGTAAGGQTYPMLGIREGHHELSHHGNDEGKLAKLRKIDRYNVSLFTYIVQQLKATAEGDGNLLDHSIVYYGSGLGNANAHTPFDLPVLVAGRGGGRLRSGQHIKLPLDTPLNNLWVTVLAAIDTPTPTFGDSTGPISELLSRTR
jgi:hypothetical protein